MSPFGALMSDGGLLMHADTCEMEELFPERPELEPLPELKELQPIRRAPRQDPTRTTRRSAKR